MRVFVTGATGFIGSAVVRELLAAGHQVLGLARSDAGAAALHAAGAQVHRGDLADLDGLRAAAAASDGVAHLGFNHNFATYKQNCEDDRAVVAALGGALAGSDRPLIVTSGTAIVPPGRLGTEADPPAAGSDVHPRAASEEAATAVAERGGRVSVVRLPPSVHGVGDRGFVPLLAGVAREKGVSAYVGEGANRWPAVHRFDAARLFRLALEGGAAEFRYHGAAEEGVPFREIAAAIGRQLGVPTVSKSPEEAAEHFGWFGGFASVDNPTSSEHTRAALGWQPSELGLIADVDRAEYFAPEAAAAGAA